MPPGQPSRRSLLGLAAAAFAWLTGASRAGGPPAAPTPPAPQPQAPPVIRVAEAAADAPGGPFVAGTTVTHHYDAHGGITYSSYPAGAPAPLAVHTLTYSYDLTPLPTPAPAAPAPPRKVHASCRLETPGGEALGREEYEAAVEGGRRIVRVTTLGPGGEVVKAEDVPF